MLAQNPKQNHLLSVLPEADYERLLPHLERVPLALGLALYESGSARWCKARAMPTGGIAIGSELAS